MTRLHRTFGALKRVLPPAVTNPIRAVATALLTPIVFSYQSGHFRSSLWRAAVTKGGEPLPWYTYPSIEFLSNRRYDDRVVLEFGGGQSTLWWAKRARHVVTLEGNLRWYATLKAKIPANVDLHCVSIESATACVAAANDVLRKMPFSAYDVVIIDGLYRYEMIEVARRVVAPTGVIVCDNAEGYGFYEGFSRSDLLRVDFAGNAPGVMLPHVTSIFFNPSSFVFSARHALPPPVHV